MTKKKSRCKSSSSPEQNPEHSIVEANLSDDEGRIVRGVQEIV